MSKFWERMRSRFKENNMSDNFKTGSAFVAVHKNPARPGNLMYIIINDRATFDLIDLPPTDHGPMPHGHVISKNIEHGDQYLVFQCWIDRPKP
jgi:hypothetical protein